RAQAYLGVAHIDMDAHFRAADDVAQIDGVGADKIDRLYMAFRPDDAHRRGLEAAVDDGVSVWRAGGIAGADRNALVHQPLEAHGDLRRHGFVEVHSHRKPDVAVDKGESALAGTDDRREVEHHGCL